MKRNTSVMANLSQNNLDLPVYTVKTVTLHTGVPAMTLRAWERRYQILVADRTAGGHRLYSERDIESIKWLKQQIDRGVSIGRAAEMLKHLQSSGEGLTPVVQPAPADGPRSIEAIVADLHQALVQYNEASAEKILDEAYSLYPIEAVCMGVIFAVFQQLGDDWQAGRIQVATEHFATNYLRRKMVALIDTGTTTRPGTIVTGCAPTELHEGGILLLSIFLRRRGWKVVYLGQTVPASKLPQALADMQADVLVLSATLPESARELKNIHSQLKKIDRKQRPVFAYGGAAFNEFPDLCDKIEGAFLGETIQLAVEAIERLMADQKLRVK